MASSGAMVWARLHYCAIYPRKFFSPPANKNMKTLLFFCLWFVNDMTWSVAMVWARPHHCAINPRKSIASHKPNTNMRSLITLIWLKQRALCFFEQIAPLWCSMPQCIYLFTNETHKTTLIRHLSTYKPSAIPPLSTKSSEIAISHKHCNSAQSRLHHKQP
jgi:hypothetical protein